jgi:hypothetical protein
VATAAGCRRDATAAGCRRDATAAGCRRDATAAGCRRGGKEVCKTAAVPVAAVAGNKACCFGPLSLAGTAEELKSRVCF